MPYSRKCFDSIFGTPLINSVPLSCFIDMGYHKTSMIDDGTTKISDLGARHHRLCMERGDEKMWASQNENYIKVNG